MIYALDTNTISFFLRGDETVKFNADTALDAGYELIIPKIVDYEIQRGLVAKSKHKILREYMEFRNNLKVGAIDDNVWQKAVYVYASLSQKGKPIGDGDTLIAAFCLANNYTLITDNISDFQYVDGLTCLNWKQ